ncbi:hypothetical protein FNV43_RR06722 [Rhamnella rubrinervis]|uniref:PWWP domain-containing protein n=1 Tax=Rhamnella rubrinervis TaxID=2594499 RepID=A0A8K0HEG1_9ROSA|nr:hypothetical protein FNV43_RR06722 [Rhamnella rubrinervis]
MGSSGEASNKAIDASVGGLVWVRRRNGSWWPGRILSLDEVSEGCLVSPRSGTPVKLLGREDASVDWYNLEKSKRVKAFRCGEYDECIEKARASAANSNRKAVKYARREDAIIHALEIENARLGKDRLDFNTRMNNSGGEHASSARESSFMSHSSNENEDMNHDVSDSEDDSDSAQELSQSGISFEEPNHISSSKVQPVLGRRRRTPNDSEDDGTEGVKRMRGLEDLGIGVKSKRKVQAGGLLELVQQDSAFFSDSNIGNFVSNGITVNGSKANSSLKRKRSQVHELLKRKNRRRPLTKVLESTAMVSVPVICDQLPSSCGSPLRGLPDGRVSGLEPTESKRSFSVVNNNNSDDTVVSCENGALDTSDQACDATHINGKMKEIEIPSISGLAENDSSDKLFDVPFVGEEKHSAAGLSPTFMSSSSGRPEIGELGRQSSQSSRAEDFSLRNESINEPGSTSSAAMHGNIGQRLDKGTSKWQSKGKRNSRQINKDRKQDSRKYADLDDESNACSAGIEHSDGFSQGSDQKADDCNGNGGSLGSYNCTLQSKGKLVAEDQADEFQDWSRHLPPRESNMRGPTAEVKLFPDASLTPQRLLPYRQSRYTVNSRYQMSDFSIRNDCSDASLYDVKLEVKANYRPQHVPLVSLMSKLNGKAIVGHPLTVEALNEGHSDVLLSRIESNLEGGEMVYGKPNSVNGRIPTKHSVLRPRRSPSKSPKTKKSGLLPKKIRKLSSLTGHKQSEDRKPAVAKPKGPVIACIPLKLVFSRINEAVNGSARQIHRVLTSSNT